MSSYFPVFRFIHTLDGCLFECGMNITNRECVNATGRRHHIQPKICETRMQVQFFPNRKGTNSNGVNGHKMDNDGTDIFRA